MNSQSSNTDNASDSFSNEKLSVETTSANGSSDLYKNYLIVDSYNGILQQSVSNSPATTRIPVVKKIEDQIKAERTYVRTLPAWIRSVDVNDPDEEEATASDRLLPSEPNGVFVAQHNHSPYDRSGTEYSQANGHSGLQRSQISQEPESRWKTFSRTIQYPREPEVEFKKVTPEWMNDNIGDYSGPWRGNLLDGDSPEGPLHQNTTRRQMWIKRLNQSLLRSPIAPLILRLTVWCFSLAALALGSSIQHFSRGGHQQGPSALMAIIVDAVALVYILYITFDEYTSKPLGLRSPSSKARLILLDLFFIVFDSANLSLAFDSLSEVTGSCTEAEVNQVLDPRNNAVCLRQKALASVLLVALIAWLMTFAISVLRLVERVHR
ncbi:hypothetical protein N7495_002493 [Penicillium taxi]|uniref:uncharacterized protein n=1 Tax=Penicillium taxi TaxID=168475 RepID=UPI002545335C|nr:uncharacterized protein N7495_002493 [Penicillium taxi]KAJ5901965.1 hypothetical protein N7495_002493 [Penicillium taxi]